MSDTTMMEDELLDESGTIEVDLLQASMTAIASADTGELDASKSAIASLTAHGDTYVSTSAIGMLDGVNVEMHQSMAGAVIADANASVHSSAAPVVIARNVDLVSSGSAVTVASEVTAAGSWIGLMAARNATLSEDSRVILDWKGALIIGLCLMGGFGLLALAVWFAARRVIGALLDLRDNLHIPDLSRLANLPHVPDWAGRVLKMTHAA